MKTLAVYALGACLAAIASIFLAAQVLEMGRLEGLVHPTVVLTEEAAQ